MSPATEAFVDAGGREVRVSSPERVIFPDSCILLDFQLQKFTTIVEGLIVYPEQMRKNIDLMGGLIKTLRYIEISPLAETGCVVDNGELKVDTVTSTSLLLA